MEEQKQTTSAPANAITEGVIWKQLLIFFFPIMLGTFFQQLYNTADAIIVGRFVGKEALAAVGGSANQISNLIIGFFVGVSSGATVIIAQHYGARKEEPLSHALHTAMAFCIFGSIIITVIGYAAAPVFLRWMNTPKDMMQDSVTYLRIFFLGILFVFIYNIGSSILRSVGDSRRPLYYLIVCCFLNIGLDLLFVLIFHMGIAGAAIATVLSQAVSAILILSALMRTTDIYRLHLRRITFYKQSLENILHIGIPAGLQSVMYSVSNIIIQTALNALGTDTVAAWTAFGKMDAFYWMVISAFGIAATTFVGQNYGAGKYTRVKKSVSICIKITLAAAVIMSVFFLTAGRYLFHLFTNDPAVIQIGIRILTYMAPAYALFVFIEIYSGALRGIGDVIIPAIMTCCGVCIFRSLWVFILVPLSPTIETITLSYPVSWGITAVLFIIYWRKKQKHFGCDTHSISVK